MALNFPDSPTDGQVFNNYYWDDTATVWRNLSDLNTYANFSNTPTGTYTDGFDYKYISFTANGTLTVTRSGFADVLLVGGGGGGGASASGTNAASSTGGNAGAGISSSITGTTVSYADGGAGGGATSPGTAIGSGGVGATNSVGGSAGVDGTGSGGGGGTLTTYAGGSGIVIVRVRT